MRLFFVVSVVVSTALASQLVFDLQENIEPRDFAKANGLIFERRLFGSVCVFSSPTSRHSRSLLEQTNINGVKWGEEQIARKHYKRTIARSKRLVDDPLYSQQWHLLSSAGSAASVDLDLIPHDSSGSNGGSNVIIAIVDDGLQFTHPELADRYIGNFSWNFNDGTPSDPSPRDPHDGHGTSAACVAVGTKLNGHCGRGVAWGARVAGIRLIAQAVTGATEAEALSLHSNHIRIYSNSWGPYDSGEGIDGPSRVTREALAYFTTLHNKIYVWASGNGRDNGDTCAFDGYAGNMYVNSIGAVDYNGEQAWYSEGCANLIAVAPSSGVYGKGITTGDLVGSAGYDPTECTDSFGGTSSAAPLASGIIALLLEKNPALTWRDVKHVIAKGATQINAQDASWHTNARGYHHSNKYGFGLLKVPRLLLTLQNYTLLGEERKQKQALSSVIHPKQKEGANSFIINMTNTQINFVEIAIVRIALTHASRGDMEIRLISPEGTVSILANRRANDRNANYPTDGWTFSSLHFWGEAQADGLWEVQVDSGGKAKVQWFTIGLFGF